MHNKTVWRHKTTFLGYGGVAQCFFSLFLKHVETNLSGVTVIDSANKSAELAYYIEHGLKFVQLEVNEANFEEVFETYVGPQGLMVDLSLGQDVDLVLKCCEKYQALYVNSSSDEFNFGTTALEKTIEAKTCYPLYSRLNTLRGRSGPTVVVDHGMNPGLISHFVKQGLLDMAKSVLKIKNDSSLKKAYETESFAALAMALNIQVVHVSEKDTQRSGRVFLDDTLSSTWSGNSFLEESMTPAQLGWGTHEPALPKNAVVPTQGPKNMAFLKQTGMNTLLRSWVPSGEFIGMVDRHAEVFTISNFLTVRKKALFGLREKIYRPTVAFVYQPCPEMMAGLLRARGNGLRFDGKVHIMKDDIVSGSSSVGALLMGPMGCWWTGSVLDIEQTRNLLHGHNATVLQVAAGVLAAVLWAMEHPQRGFCFPEDLPHNFALSVAKPYLGTWVSNETDWTPEQNASSLLPNEPAFDKKYPWRFSNFFVV